MLTLNDISTFIISTPDICGNRPHIAGHQITVHNIAIDFNAGRSPETIIAEKPQLTLAQVYAALAYYHANKESIDAEIAADDCLEAKTRVSIPSKVAITDD